MSWCDLWAVFSVAALTCCSMKRLWLLSVCLVSRKTQYVWLC